MQPDPPPSSPTPGPGKAVAAAEAERMLAKANALRHARAAGDCWLPLQGKRIGLVCEDQSHETGLFRRCAEELGAQVALIRLDSWDFHAPADVRRIAQVLGRLYDAVACQCVPPALLRQIESNAGVPVFADIASPDHPSAGLAAQLDGHEPADCKRRLVLQAVLLDSIV